MKTAIVTDSTCDLSDELIAQHDIYLIPMRIVYSDGEYRDKYEITSKEIYNRLGNEIPTSSLPFTQDIEKIMEEIISKEYTNVIVITVSSGLSGTNNMVNLLMENYKSKINIQVVDSLTLSMGLGYLVLECAKELKASSSVEAAVKRISDARKTMTAMFVVKTLQYLKKGGRIGKVEGTVGELLHIKPIIAVNDEGVYYTMAKVRGRKASMQKMVELIKYKYKDKTINISVVHGMAKDEAQNLLDRLISVLDVKLKSIVQISPVLGMHTGAGLLGIIAYEA